MLLGMVLLAGCETGIFERPCPRVTEFSVEMQRRAAAELDALPQGAVLPNMMDRMAEDRAYNRAICPR